jgi:hypothetical protein
MNAQNIIALYKAGKAAYKVGSQVKNIYDLVSQGGKDKVGSVLMRDSNGNLWEVKVRATGKRGRYIKITSKPKASREIRASVDDYKPEKYLFITSDEWTIFALFAEGKDDWQGRLEDQDLYSNAKSILNRLVR